MRLAVVRSHSCLSSSCLLVAGQRTREPSDAIPISVWMDDYHRSLMASNTAVGTLRHRLCIGQQGRESKKADHFWWAYFDDRQTEPSSNCGSEACKAVLDGIKNRLRDVDWAVSLPEFSTWPNGDRRLQAARTSADEAVPMPFRLSICGIEEFVAASCKDFTWKSQSLHYSYPRADGTVAD